MSQPDEFFARMQELNKALEDGDDIAAQSTCTKVAAMQKQAMFTRPTTPSTARCAKRCCVMN